MARVLMEPEARNITIYLVRVKIEQEMYFFSSLYFWLF